MDKNWLEQQLDAAARDYDSWPESMKSASRTREYMMQNAASEKQITEYLRDNGIKLASKFETLAWGQIEMNELELDFTKDQNETLQEIAFVLRNVKKIYIVGLELNKLYYVSKI